MQRKKSLKSILIFIVLLLILGSGGVTFGLNKFMNTQKMPAHTSQSKKIFSSTTTGGVRKMVGTATNVYLTRIATNNTITRNVASAGQRSSVPHIAPNMPKITDTPTNLSAGSTPATDSNATSTNDQNSGDQNFHNHNFHDQNNDSNATSTTDPNATPTIDPNTVATTDPNATSTTDPNAAPTTDPNVAPTTDPNATATTDPNATPTTGP